MCWNICKTKTCVTLHSINYHDFLIVDKLQLFFVDDAQPDPDAEIQELDFDNLDIDQPDSGSIPGSDEGEHASDENEAIDDERENSTVQLEQPEPSSSKLNLPSATRKKAAWTDPDDSTIEVSLADNKRLRKLRDAPDERVVGGAQYEAKLRREYERINPAPEWAANSRKKAKAKKRRRSSSATSEEDGGLREDQDTDTLLTSTGGILSSTRTEKLAKGIIGIERLRDVNQSAKAEGTIKAVEFHPSPRIPVLLTASADRRLRLFNVRTTYYLASVLLTM